MSVPATESLAEPKRNCRLTRGGGISLLSNPEERPPRGKTGVLTSMEYYLHVNGAQTGPYTLKQLRAMWADGSATGETFFWHEGAADWAPLQTMAAQLQAAKLPSAIESSIQPAEPRQYPPRRPGRRFPCQPVSRVGSGIHRFDKTHSARVPAWLVFWQSGRPPILLRQHRGRHVDAFDHDRRRLACQCRRPSSDRGRSAPSGNHHSDNHGSCPHRPRSHD